MERPSPSGPIYLAEERPVVDVASRQVIDMGMEANK